MGEPGGLPSVYGIAQSRTQLTQLSSSSQDLRQGVTVKRTGKRFCGDRTVQFPDFGGVHTYIYVS